MTDVAMMAGQAVAMLDEKPLGTPLTAPMKRTIAGVTHRVVADGGMRKKDWVAKPLFLPSSNAEWSSMLNSRQSGESDTKAAASQWFYENYRVLMGNAANLDCIATAFHYLEDARAADPEDVETLEWQNTLWEMAQAEYGVDIAQAPHGRGTRAMKMWAESQCTDGHPVPEWIRQDKAEAEVDFSRPRRKPKPKPNPYSDDDGEFSMAGAFTNALRGDQ